jgi:hypothetical protein
MKCYRTVLAFLACCAIFAVQADARTLRGRVKTFHRPIVKRAANCPLHLTASGDLADCRGWRLRRNATGWDNTCFRSLDHLPSMYACGPSTF